MNDWTGDDAAGVSSIDGYVSPDTPVRCKCNPPGPSPVGVALDCNGRTTTCRLCNGTGWIRANRVS